MSQPFSTRRFHANETPGELSSPVETSIPERVEQLRRISELVAAGESPIPTELTSAEFQVVVTEVSRQRHERLVHFIARAIALDLQRSREA